MKFGWIFQVITWACMSAGEGSCSVFNSICSVTSADGNGRLLCWWRTVFCLLSTRCCSSLRRRWARMEWPPGTTLPSLRSSTKSAHPVGEEPARQLSSCCLLRLVWWVEMLKTRVATVCIPSRDYVKHYAVFYDKIKGGTHISWWDVNGCSYTLNYIFCMSLMFLTRTTSSDRSSNTNFNSYCISSSF